MQGAAYLLYGHGGPAPAPAHPFVRPAFDTKADEAFSEIKRVLRDELKNRYKLFIVILLIINQQIRNY